jgi:branched-chain amino acid transport system permease protein
MLDFINNNISTVHVILINIALGLSIYLTLSPGLLSLASIGFMALGAYVAAVAGATGGLPLALALLGALLIAAALAVPLGLVLLRLRDVYLAIATLGFGEIVRLVVLNGDKLLRTITGDEALVVFNGAEGITLPYSAPKLLLGLESKTWPMLLYVLVLIYLVATLHGSRYGRILASIRQDEAAAATLGIQVLRYKLLAFVLSALVAAGAGALSAPLVRVITPRNYVFGRAVDVLASAVLGGMTHWAGPIVGALVLTALPEVLRFLKEQREVVNGLIIMISIIYLPRGLADPRLWGAWRRRSRRGP